MTQNVGGKHAENLGGKHAEKNLGGKLAENLGGKLAEAITPSQHRRYPLAVTGSTSAFLFESPHPGIQLEGFPHPSALAHLYSYFSGWRSEPQQVLLQSGNQKAFA